MKKFRSFVALAVLCCICGCATLSHDGSASSSKTSITRISYPDNAFKEVPREYIDKMERGGKIEKFTYKTRNNQVAGSPEFEKYALVYLPYGYDEKDTGKQYNVLYLMHGGAVTQEWYFAGEGKESPLKSILDHMIAKGEIQPLIVCAVSYLTPYNNDATKNCIDFHYELDQDIIPVFEKKYHTYAKDVTAKGIAASRTHRAFSGYSMGACATWAAFEHCIDEIAYFLPMSGDCWALGQGKQPEVAKYLVDVMKKKGMTSKDFKIYAGCGSNDIAEPNLTPLVKEMDKYHEMFIYTNNFASGNLFNCVYPNGGHDDRCMWRLMYNGLPKMFD